MRLNLVILILIGINGCNSCNKDIECMQDFEHGYTETFETIVTRAVGPTTIPGARPLADAVGPYVHLATNGDDADDGSTPALAVLTLTKAITQLGVLGRTTIQVIRNGAVGDLDFTVTTAETIPAAKNLQCELLEECKFIITGVGAAFLLGAGAAINGIFVEFLTGGGLSAPSASIENCKLTSTDIVINDSIGVTIDYSIIKGVAGGIITGGTGATVSINNSIIMSDTGALINVTAGTDVDYTINVDRCLLLTTGVSTGVTAFAEFLGFLTYTSTLTINADSSFVLTDLLHNSVFADSDVYSVDINTDFCSLSTTAIEQVSGNFATITLINTNALINTTSPLFINQVQGIANADAESLRLQAKGKATSTGGKYQLNSPLIGAGLAGVDVNPWDETTTGPVRTFASLSTIHYPASDYSKSRPFNKPILIKDLVGGIHTKYTGRSREFNLGWGSGDKYASNNDLDTLEEVTADTGSIRWYPRGIGNTIYDLGQKGSFLATSATEGTFTPDIIPGIPMKINKWQGAWIIILGKHYRISSNTVSKFILVDKALEGLPTDSVHQFTIEYWLIKFAINEIDMAAIQQFFTDFLKDTGSSFSEFQVGRSPLNDKLFEMKDFNIKLLETIDLEEATVL